MTVLKSMMPRFVNWISVLSWCHGLWTRINLAKISWAMMPGFVNYKVIQGNLISIFYICWDRSNSFDFMIIKRLSFCLMYATHNLKQSANYLYSIFRHFVYDLQTYGKRNCFCESETSKSNMVNMHKRTKVQKNLKKSYVNGIMESFSKIFFI